MARSYLSQYFAGVALKTLTAVEANTTTSNQHEYNGNRDLVRLFGRATSKHRFPARFVYVSADEKEKLVDAGLVTWYDARQNHPSRSEHRLYFPTTGVSRRAAVGDLLVIGMLRDNSVLVVVAKDGSPIAADLRRLFGVVLSTDERFALWQKEDGLHEEEARSLLHTIGVLDRGDPATSSTSLMPAGTAVVVISRPSDYAAVIGQLRDISEQADELGTLFEVGRYDSAVGVWEIAIVQLGLGALFAANAVEHAVERFHPEVVVLLGVAQSVQEDLSVGDVVVASAMYSWDGNGVGSRRSETPASSYRVQQRALKESVGEAWLTRKRLVTGGELPRVVVAPVASSTRSIVGSAELGSTGAVAVDTEDTALLGELGHRNGVELLVVKGIASTDQAPNSGDEKLASDNATAFAFQVLSTLEIDKVREPTSAESRVVQNDVQPYLSRFRIRAIRSIQEIDWEVPAAIRAGWHVLVGINASGKTTALRCVALALISNRDAQALGQNWATWVLNGAASGDAVVTVATVSSEHDVRVGFSPAPEAPEEMDIVTSHQPPHAVFSVGYGPFRRFSGGDYQFKKALAVTPGALRHITLFSERADLADSLIWLRDLYVEFLENQDRFDEAIQKFINSSALLPSGVRLAEVSANRIAFEDGNGCIIGIEDLSDGFRSVLSLVLDILRHLSDHERDRDLFSPDGAYVVASGIVLIDEIDVHLHPKWQQEIGTWFKKHFPNFQFIVATHSLFVCQSADSVFMLPDPGAGGSGRMLTEVELNQIRYGTVLDGYGTGVFGKGVDESEESRIRAQELAILNLKQLRKGLTSEEKATQARLRAILPTGDVLCVPAVRE